METTKSTVVDPQAEQIDRIIRLIMVIILVLSFANDPGWPRHMVQDVNAMFRETMDLDPGIKVTYR